MTRLRRKRVSTGQFLLSVQFAKDVINSNLDKLGKRGQTDPIKIYSDILIGKVAEFAIYNSVSALPNVSCSYPDLEVYDSKKKSFDADLVTSSGFNIHVKSCRSDSNFPISWVFQKEDELVTGPKDSDYIALCVVDRSFIIDADIIKATDAKYSDLKKSELKSKLAIYKDSL